MMDVPLRVLFVCAGNICRSPMAEALLRHIATSRPGLNHVDVASAGTIALDGSRPISACLAALRERFGLDMSAHRARRIRQDTEAEIILTMDPEVTRHVRALSPKGEVQLLGDYAGSPGEIVEDPYGGSDDEYKACVEQLGRLVTAVADRLEAAASAEPSTP